MGSPYLKIERESIFGIDLVLKGFTGTGNLLFLLGMLYFGFVLIRERPAIWERIFFWAAAGQLMGLCLVALVSLATLLFGQWSMEGGGVNLAWVSSTCCKGIVLLSSLVGAVALVATGRRESKSSQNRVPSPPDGAGPPASGPNAGRGATSGAGRGN